MLSGKNLDGVVHVDPKDKLRAIYDVSRYFDTDT